VELPPSPVFIVLNFGREESLSLAEGHVVHQPAGSTLSKGLISRWRSNSRPAPRVDGSFLCSFCLIFGFDQVRMDEVGEEYPIFLCVQPDSVPSGSSGADEHQEKEHHGKGVVGQKVA